MGVSCSHNVVAAKLYAARFWWITSTDKMMRRTTIFGGGYTSVPWQRCFSPPCSRSCRRHPQFTEKSASDFCSSLTQWKLPTACGVIIFGSHVPRSLDNRLAAFLDYVLKKCCRAPLCNFCEVHFLVLGLRSWMNQYLTTSLSSFWKFILHPAFFSVISEYYESRLLIFTFSW